MLRWASISLKHYCMLMLFRSRPPNPNKGNFKHLNFLKFGVNIESVKYEAFFWQLHIQPNSANKILVLKNDKSEDTKTIGQTLFNVTPVGGTLISFSLCKSL